MKKILMLLCFISFGLFGCLFQKSIHPDSPDDFLEIYINAHKNRDEHVLDELFYPIDKLSIHPDQAKYLKESIERSKKADMHFEKDIDGSRVKLVKAGSSVKTNIVGELNTKTKDEWKYVFEPEYLIYIYKPDSSYSIYAFGRRDGRYYGVPIIPSVETARALLDKASQDK